MTGMSILLFLALTTASTAAEPHPVRKQVYNLLAGEPTSTDLDPLIDYLKKLNLRGRPALPEV